MRSLQKVGGPGKASRGKKGKPAKVFGILTQAQRKRRNTVSTANPESLHRNRLLLAAVPSLEWRRPEPALSEDPNPPEAFSPFSSPPLQLVDRQLKGHG
ncbi:hypothetical protein EDM58_05750 [Brevibacillus panacihumi]|uniref:Uncharacterized protein n=1 Tax=Brevibacillus panacihumi TaxID=497735 RepID=A0A3M8D4R8_9BACL|nr:hypothetical protein EDM58_05750 [Brevibacillus panacihumi]